MLRLALLVLLLPLPTFADPITVSNFRFGNQSPSGNPVALLDQGTTSYTVNTTVWIFFDIYGGQQGCPPCAPQGPVVGLFSGSLPLGQPSVWYNGSGYLENISTIGIRAFMSAPAVFTGTVSFSLGNGTPLAYVDTHGVTRSNPSFSIQVISVPVVSIPEASGLLLIGSGLIGLAYKLRKRLL